MINGGLKIKNERNICPVLEKVIQAYRNIGLRYGNGAEEDIKEMNNSSTYIDDLEKAHEDLIQELTKCGYF